MITDSKVTCKMVFCVTDQPNEVLTDWLVELTDENYWLSNCTTDCLPTYSINWLTQADVLTDPSKWISYLFRTDPSRLAFAICGSNCMFYYCFRSCSYPNIECLTGGVGGAFKSFTGGKTDFPTLLYFK